MKQLQHTTLLSAALLALAAACQDHEAVPTQVKLQAHSVTPPLVGALAGFENIEILPLIGSDDVLPGSPDFVYGGQPDGAGLLKNPAGPGYIWVTNHEYMRSASRVQLDETFKPVSGEYIVNYNGGVWRLCSATMATCLLYTSPSPRD